MRIQVLGTGCAKCGKLVAETEKAVGSAGVQVQVEKVQDIDEIVAFGVMATPALVLDGQVRSTGRIPPAQEIATWLKAAAAKEEA